MLAETVQLAQINIKNIKCCLKQSRQHKLIFKIYHGGQNSRGSPNKSLKFITLAKTVASAQIYLLNL